MTNFEVRRGVAKKRPEKKPKKPNEDKPQLGLGQGRGKGGVAITTNYTGLGCGSFAFFFSLVSAAAQEFSLFVWKCWLPSAGGQ